MDKQALLEETYRSAFEDELEKVAKTRWVKELSKSLAKKNHRLSEDIITSVTKGKVDQYAKGYKGHVSNVRATIASGGIKRMHTVRSYGSPARVYLSPEGVVSAAKRAAREVRRMDLKRGGSTIEDRKWLKDEIGEIISKNYDDYAKKFKKAMKKNPGKTVDVYHAGNKPHIKRFLSGDAKGIDVEGRGKGIWVHPVGKKNSVDIGDRMSFYAGSSAMKYGGRPSVLYAKIDPKHLKSVPNLYEAALLGKKVKYLKKPKITTDYLSESSAFGRLPISAPPADETYAAFKLGGKIIKRDKKKLLNK